MKILFTGASSFTGYWFVKELVKAGHVVFTTYTRSGPSEYEGIRKIRIEKLNKISDQTFNCQFGSPQFLDLVNSESKWDLFCHHAAEVTNYKSPHFDYIKAVKKNTYNLPDVFGKLSAKSCDTVILTGSVFENDEGNGAGELKAFSLYGLSKGITYTVFRYYAELFNINLGKFVIPNPFGPFEDYRFTTFLMKTWLDKKIAVVNTPDYIRDNIHVSLLARVYSNFVVSVKGIETRMTKINPSGYAERQGDFANRFAKEMRKRFNLDCELELKQQDDFPEPKIRININNAAKIVQNWSEEYAWNELAEYYKNYLLKGLIK